jgi:hypothetical protein
MKEDFHGQERLETMGTTPALINGLLNFNLHVLAENYGNGVSGGIGGGPLAP